jgi:hypothetical protein
MPSDKEGLPTTNDHGSMRARSPSSDRRSADRFTIHDFNFIKVLGKGSFGKVNV